MPNNVSIIFDTNAASAAKSVRELGAAMDKVIKTSRGGPSGGKKGATPSLDAFRGSAKSGRQAMGNFQQFFEAAQRPDLSRQSGLNAINSATRRGLTKRLDTATGVAAKLLSRTKGSEKLVAELNEGVGYALDEGLRPLREASVALRKKASTTKSKKKQEEYTNYADEIDKYVAQYDRLKPGQKASKRAFKEADSMAALEKAQSSFQKLGVDIGSITDLSAVSNRISGISPAIAQSIKSLRDSEAKISPQDYLARLAEISKQGVATLTTQRAAFEKQIQTKVSGAAGKGGALASIFKERFGDPAAMLASGKKFDFTDIGDQTAFSAWKDSLRKGLGGYITQQLDPKGIKQLTALGDAKKTGDTAQIQTALATAEKAVKGRLSKMYEQLAKLEEVAKSTGDRDLTNIINGFKRQISAQGQVLGSQLSDGVNKLQGSIYKTLDHQVQMYAKKAGVLRGSKTQATPQRLAEFSNNLDRATGQLISDYVASFKTQKFQSFGGKTMAEAGFNRNQQNILNTQILGAAGYYSSNTQEGRMDSLAKAVDLVRPTLEKLGFQGAELEDAEASLTSVIHNITSQYRELANQTQGLNAEQSKLARKRAEELIAKGDYAGARALGADVTQYMATKVNAGRPPASGGVGGTMAATEADLNEQAKKDREALMAHIETQIANREKNPKNTFMGKLRTISAFAGSLLNVYGLVASAVGTVVNTVTQLIDKANQLDKVTSTVNALGGSFENFSMSMQVATKQQATYGGTLTETFQGLTSLVPLTKRYGADLGQLDNIARRLAVVDPLQGFQGAAIALKEFFSGDITSLSRRFEIDRKSLNSIKAAGSQLEQLAALDKALNDMGISNDVLAAKTQTAAIKFDKAGASWDNFQTLVGKGLQGTFAGTADAFSNFFSNSAKSVATLVEKEQYIIDLQKQISKLAAQFRDFGEEAKITATALDQLTSGPFFDYTALQAQTKNYGVLIDEFNTLIEKLNEIRAQENLPMLSYFSKNDAQLIKELTLIAEKTNIPVKVLLENRDATGKQKTLGQTTTEAQNKVGFWGTLATAASFGAYRDPALQRYTDLLNISGRNSTSEYGGVLKNINPVMFPEMFNKANPQDALGIDKQANENAFNNLLNSSSTLAEALAAQTKDINSLTDMQFLKHSQDLMTTSNIDYSKTMLDLRTKYESGILTQEESDRVLLQMIEVNKKLLTSREKASDIEDSYITNMMKSIQSFGSTNAKDTVLKKIDDFTQKRAEQGQASLARLYGQVGGGAAFDPNNKRAKEILDLAKQQYNIDRETLYYMNEMDKQQAQLALNANKTVGAYTALTNLASGLNISLQDAVSYAMDFNSQLTGLTSGAVFNQLSLQDRLTLNSQSYSNINQVNGPQNIGDLVNTLGQSISLRQEQADAAPGSNDNTKKILDKYEKDKTKIIKDAEDERTKIMDDWAEKTADLIRQSEYEKRAATADFYEALFQNDNLTMEQQQQFSAQREAIRQEADTVRSTDPAKAKLIMDAGEQKIKNEMDAAEKVAKYQKDNKDIDEEIGDLQKDLSKAKDEEARKDIQRKIDKLNQQKLENQREIDQVIAVQNARRIADEQRLKDAREGISEEQKARDKAINDSKDAELKALADLKTQRDADMAEEQTNRNKNSKAQIMNLQDYQQLQSVGTVMMNAAGMAATGTPSDQVTAYLNKNLGDIEKYFTERGTPISGDILKFIKGQKELVGSVGVNPAIQAMAAFMGLGTGGNIPGQSGPTQTFIPYENKKISYSGEGFSAGQVYSTKGPVTIPDALKTNETAVSNNTLAINALTTVFNEMKNNYYYVLWKRLTGTP